MFAKAKQAAIYWRADDPMVYAELLFFINIPNRLLEFYDNPEVDEVADMVEISSTVTSKNKQSNEQALVPGKDDTMFDLNQSLQPGAKANNNWVTAIRIRNLIPHIFIAYCTYNLYLNGGRFNKHSLKNDHFEWVKGVIRCTMHHV